MDTSLSVSRSSVASSSSNRSTPSAVYSYPNNDPFSIMSGKSIYYIGCKSGDNGRLIHLFEICSDIESTGTVITDFSLISLGYSIHRYDRELFVLSKDNLRYFVRTRGFRYEKNSPF